MNGAKSSHLKSFVFTKYGFRKPRGEETQKLYFLMTFLSSLILYLTCKSFPDLEFGFSQEYSSYGKCGVIGDLFIFQ